MAGAERHVSEIPYNIKDSVKHHFTFGKRLKVVVENLGLSCTEHLPVTLEVADEFLLFCINAENRKPDFLASLPNVSNVIELSISILRLCHRQILDKRTSSESKGLSLYLTIYEGMSKCMPSFFYDKASTFPSRGFVMS